MHAVEKGSSQKDVGEKFGVAKSTSLTFGKITRRYLTPPKRCIVRHAKFDLVDKACWKWFCQQRSKGAPVSGVLLQEKACSFVTKLYPDADLEGFKGSTGWLDEAQSMPRNQEHPATMYLE